MVSWAFSWLSQKPGWPIWLVNCSRRDCLPGMSKTVPEVTQTGQDFVSTAAQIGVHRFPFVVAGIGSSLGMRVLLLGTIAQTVSHDNSDCLGVGSPGPVRRPGPTCSTPCLLRYHEVRRPGARWFMRTQLRIVAGSLRG